jgi:hypothetical protein
MRGRIGGGEVSCLLPEQRHRGSVKSRNFGRAASVPRRVHAALRETPVKVLAWHRKMFGSKVTSPRKGVSVGEPHERLH